ncbi:RNA polymerase sigma factor [Flavobacterium granuli]|uniref:RNA polymerase sigma-70 factor (ECF subfamily) n=1 Tax=Flavobacterium granuli TaxID=280093 RepID=A0A1M5NVJ4_9FLAO|nr:RNA polymerase sigma factor [Flavobacterium granuli]PRZ23411.1 RNA polymerase sigma-70 factor (ECF subfamily) [Flavobacterium granuli]SHG93498.1 RNA polymerase sigma-70 factor, ECF subfamily [Flavobacterium granuli]
MANEADFISKLISNNQKDKAFKQLLELYQVRLYWHIRKLVITHENTDDVLQNTFVRIYKSLPNFSQESSLYTWMHKIAYNESLRFLEQNKKKHHISIDDVNRRYLDNLVEDSFFEGNDLQLKLQTVLSELPEKQRQIFNMKYYDDLKFREIAAILGIKEGTIKTSYYNSVKHIEKNISKIKLLPLKKV